MSEMEDTQRQGGPRVAILGAGGLGTAIAAGLWKKGRIFTLWTPEEDVAESLRTYQENVKYLPGIKIPKEVDVGTDLESVLDGAGTIVFTIPSELIRNVARRCAAVIAHDAVLVIAAPGLEHPNLTRLSEVVSQEMPDPLKTRIAVISGPALAFELGRGEPAGVDIASGDPVISRHVRSVFAMKRFRFKLRRDVAGLEAASAFVDLYAVGAGICDGLGLGNNIKAALLTKALNELVICSRAFGGKATTLYGLAGAGHLFAESSSTHSRNRALGEHAGQGHRVTEVPHGADSITEGVAAAHNAHELAARNGLRLPLAETIYRILNAQDKPEAIIKAALP